MISSRRPRLASEGAACMLTSSTPSLNVACALSAMTRQVLELELEREDGRWIYEVKLLQADGQLLKLDLDARTAEVLSVKRRRGANSQENP